MNHYLWKKPRAQWTDKDLENLEGKSVSGVSRPPDTVKRTTYRQPVVAKKLEDIEVFYSVVLCAKALEIDPSVIYSRINGHQKNDGEYQFFKSKING